MSLDLRLGGREEGRNAGPSLSTDPGPSTSHSGSSKLNHDAILEGVRRSFAPRVAVLSSPDVDGIAQANGVPNLAALLRPFEDSVEGVNVRSSRLEVQTCKVYPVRFDSLSLAHDGDYDQEDPYSRMFTPPEECLDAITAHLGANAKRWDAELPIQRLVAKTDVGPELHSASVDRLTPWYADFREMLVGSVPLSEHSTFGHPVSVLLAVSTASLDPLNALAELFEASQPQNSKAFASRSFIDPTVLRYYLLLHDVSRSGSDLTEARQLLESIRKSYGLHCCLLPINSAIDASRIRSADLSLMWERSLQLDPRAPLRRPNTSEPTRGRWSTPGPGGKEARGGSARSEDRALPDVPSERFAAYLDDDDVKRLRGFVRELVAQSLVPFMEQCVQQWHEQMQASRRGLTNRLFGAGRKIFGFSGTAGRTGALAPQAPGWNAQTESYPFAAIEAQTRRLADFAFMTRDYRLSAAMYELCRKDFALDKASKYSAGATEMLGLSQLLASPSSRSVAPEVEGLLMQATTEYASRGTLQLDSLRAVLLHYEVFRAYGHHHSAARSLQRFGTTVAAEEPLIAAVLFEQTALAHLRFRSPGIRKYAMYLIVAGHKYQESGQLLLAQRAFSSAASFYAGSQLAAVQDHLQFHLGRQAFAEGKAEEAVEHLLALMHGDEVSQDSSKQATYLENLLEAFRYVESSGRHDALELGTPLVDVDGSFVDVDVRADGSDNAVWERLEGRFLDVKYGRARQGDDRPRLFERLHRNTVASGTPFQVSLALRNPLSTPLRLSDLRIVFSAENGSALESDTLNEVLLEGHEHRQIGVSVATSALGNFRASIAHFSIDGQIPFSQPMTKRGKRLQKTKAQRVDPTYAPDESLAVTVLEPSGKLRVEAEQIPSRLWLGEEVQMRLQIQNDGKRAISALSVLTEDCAMASAREAEGKSYDNTIDPATPTPLLSEGASLAAGDSKVISLNVRASRTGLLSARALFVYDNGNSELRVCKFEQQLYVDPLLDVTVLCHPTRDEGTAPSFALSVDIQRTLPSDEELIEVVGISSISRVWVGKLEIKEELSLSSTRFSADATLPLERQLPDQMSNHTYTVEQLRATLLGKEVDQSRRPPPVRLHHSSFQERSLDHFLEIRRQWKRAKLSVEFPLLTAADRMRVFPLFEPDDLDVTVEWYMPSSGRRGWVDVIGLAVGPQEDQLLAVAQDISAAGPSRALYEQTMRAKATLLASILGSRLREVSNPLLIRGIGGDELRGSSQIVQRKLEIVNFSTVFVASFELQLEVGDSSMAAWTGRLTFRGAVKPESSVVIAPKMKGRGSAQMYQLPGWRLVASLRYQDGRPGQWSVCTSQGPHGSLMIL